MRLKEETMKELGRVLCGDKSFLAECCGAYMRSGPFQPFGGDIPRVMSRGEVADLFGVSPRRVDQYGRVGLIRRVRLAGLGKAVGYDEGSVRAALSGRGFPVKAIEPKRR